MNCAAGCCTIALARGHILLDTGLPALPTAEQLEAELTPWPDDPCHIRDD